MRSLLLTLTLIACGILLAAMACTDSPTESDDPIEYVTWETTWGGPRWDFANSVLAVEDGVIVAGRSAGAACAVMFDGETGSPVWEMTRPGPLPGEMVDIASTPDGGAVLAGYIGWYDATIFLDSYFIKITSEGEVEWEGRYSGVLGKSEAFCVTVASDGTPFAAGLSRTGPQIPVQPAEEYIIKLDPANGEVVKEMTLGNPIDAADIKDMIAVTVPEPGLVLVGYRGGGPFITKVNEELDTVLWDRTLEIEDAIPYEITEMHDKSGYVAAGAINDFTQMCLIGFDLEGNMIWSNVFANGNSDRSDARGVAALPDGYLVAGFTGTDDNKADVYLVKTDLRGEVVHDTTYGWVNSPELALDVDVAPKGGGYVAARTFRTDSTGYHPDFYVIRTDPNGGQ